MVRLRNENDYWLLAQRTLVAKAPVVVMVNRGSVDEIDAVDRPALLQKTYEDGLNSVTTQTSIDKILVYMLQF